MARLREEAAKTRLSMTAIVEMALEKYFVDVPIAKGRANRMGRESGKNIPVTLPLDRR